MADSNRGTGPRKSWKERDAQKDRGGGARREEPRNERTVEKDARSSKQYRAALEALFEKGGLAKVAEKLGGAGVPAAAHPPQAQPASIPGAPAGPPPTKVIVAPDERTVLRKKIIDAIGRDEITRAMDRWLKEFPLPADFEVLEQAIEHRKEDRVLEVLALLEKMLEKDKPKRSRMLAAKLRFLEETCGDKEMSDTAIRLRARLG